MPAKRPKIETGPFGGRFYRKGNKKIYVTKNPKSGPCKGEQTEVGKRGGVYCMKNGKRVYYNAAKVQKTKPRRTTTARPKTTRQRRQRTAPKPRAPKQPRQPRVNKHLKWLVDHKQVLLPIEEKDGAKAFITSVQAKTRKSPAVHAKYWRAQYGDAPLDGLDGRMYVVKGNRWVLARASAPPPPPPPPQEQARAQPQQPQRGRFWRQPGCKKNANILFQYFPPDVLTQDNVFRQYKDLMLTNHPDRFRYNHPDASPEELEMVRNRWEETLDAKRYLMDPKWECLD